MVGVAVVVVAVGTAPIALSASGSGKGVDGAAAFVARRRRHHDGGRRRRPERVPVLPVPFALGFVTPRAHPPAVVPRARRGVDDVGNLVGNIFGPARRRRPPRLDLFRRHGSRVAWQGGRRRRSSVRRRRRDRPLLEVVIERIVVHQVRHRGAGPCRGGRQ
jgi:hypothetical protein